MAQHEISIDPPDPGQLVNIRQRQFVVLDVQETALPSDITSHGINNPQHFVTLSSIEDDALGEELQVIWELEPGARTREKAELPSPTGFDDPRKLDAFLDSVRWGAISSADIKSLQSPFRAGIEIEEYQLDPVVRALRMPRVNLLIADDVGLGKTIESGLVIQELLLRHRARTVFVVCPASLQIQWQEQMRDKFGLEFRIVDSDLMKELRRKRGLHVNPWTHFPRLITSIDFLKRDRPLRLFRETLGETIYPRKYDILIVDEAHNVAPAGRTYYSTDSQRTMAIRTLTPHFEHKLFLTATPHNGYKESFSALLELLDNQRFARAVAPDPKQLEVVMVRRLKSELPPRWDGTPRFPKRTIEPIKLRYTEEERKAHRLLVDYTECRTQSATDAIERVATHFVLKILKKRLFSSPMAFKLTLECHLNSLKTAKRRKSITARPSLTVLNRRVDEVENEYADDEEHEELTAETIDTTSMLFTHLSKDENKLLDALKKYAGEAVKRPDTKAAALIKWIHKTIKPGGKWSKERVLIFTEYRATQKWLYDLLAHEGFATGDRMKQLYGGMDTKKREERKAAFQADPGISPIRILLATDMASEGIDLQNHCHRLIHYEIPWNPNVMEQRNGRLDRHGQKAPEVLVYHFVGEGFDKQSTKGIAKPGNLEGDLEFLMRAVIKVNTIREDLGKVGPVIATQVEEAMLGKRDGLDTAVAEAEASKLRGVLAFERDLRDQIKKLGEQLDETKKDLHISPESVKAVVDIALELTKQPPLEETTLPGIWPDPEKRRQHCPVFRMPVLKGSWARCTEGLEHPHTKEVRPITFDDLVAVGRDDVVLVHLNHRLVQMAMRLLRAEIWATETTRNINRVTARIVPGSALEYPAVIAHGRLVVLGGDNHRVHEEVISAGGIIREGRFSRLNVGQVADAIEAGTDFDASDKVRDTLRDLWPKLEEPLMRSLEARMKDRTETLDNRLQERADKEAQDITDRLEELARLIREKLKEPEPEQLGLFTESEADQRKGDISSLELRLENIPEEIEKEVAAIRARYANPEPRLFPVAVTFLVPERIARSAGGGC